MIAMGRRLRHVIATLGIGCAAAAPARASDPESPPAPASPEAADSADSQARALYDEGITQYNLKRYEAAIKTFESAYALSPYPGFLYNIAQSYRLEGREHCADALHFYRAYLRSEAEIPHRDKIEQLAAEMETCVQDVARERRSIPHESHTWVPLALGIAGGVLAAGGASLLVWATSDYHDLRDSCSPSCDPSRIDGPRLHERIGLGLAIGGGATLATAFVLWWHRRDETSRDPPTSPHAWIAPSPQGITLGGSF
jgi:hypothetical protein